MIKKVLNSKTTQRQLPSQKAWSGKRSTKAVFRHLWWVGNYRDAEGYGAVLTIPFFPGSA